MNTSVIAWRNIWRNKRRTLITAASIFFGVIFAAVMSSMQEGSYGKMIDNVVKFYSGYLQIQQEDYWENKTINNTFELTDTLWQGVREIPQVTGTAPRLESFALASSEDLTKGTVVIGIDPEKESRITDPGKWIIRGRYIHHGDAGVMMGHELADYLHLDVGDTLVLLGMGYHGVNAAGKYPVTGIFKYPLPQFNREFIYMDLPLAQDLYSAPDRITSLVLMVKAHYDIPAAKKALQAFIHAPYRLMSWDEMQPELVQMIASDRMGGNIMKIILYIIIAFGILGTVIMMFSERRRELGVMVSLGMQKTLLAGILFTETFYIGLLGVVTGIGATIPLTVYLYRHPIHMTGEAAKAFLKMGVEPVFAFSLMPPVYYNQAITVFILILLIAFYPVVRIFRLNVSEALRS